MTATATSPTVVPAGRAPARRGLSFGRVLASEWIKLRSLRSTGWTLSLTVVAMVGISVLVAASTAGLTDDDAGMGFGVNIAALAVVGYFFGQLPLVVLGALAVTGEYSTGQIRSTFAAVPTRVPALVAKALVVALAAAVTAAVAVALSLVATIPWHDALGLTLDLSDGETLRILGGAVLYLATMALLALGVGVLLRHSAAALAVVLGLIYVIELVFMAIPAAFFRNVSPFLPGTAGGRLLQEDGGPELVPSDIVLTPWQGYGVLVAWALVTFVAAAVLVRRRDA